MSSGNVFEDPGLPQAGERLAKAELARGIRHIIRGNATKVDESGATPTRIVRTLEAPFSRYTFQAP